MELPKIFPRKAMSDLSSKICAVYDQGHNSEFARTLSRFFGRVYYYHPWKWSKPCDLDLRVGTGFGEIVRLENFFEPEVMSSDLFVFPFIFDGDLQEYLRSQGKLVWGSGRMERLETDRGFFLDTLGEIGLPVPPHIRLRGISKLRDYLRENENLVIKTSKLRGSACGETWKHKNFRQSQSKLDEIAFDLGPFQEDKLFFCFEKLDTKLEGGGDLMVSDGEIQNEAIHGFERKDEVYLATHRPYSNLPELVRQVNDSILPVLKRGNMRGPISTEILFVEKGKEILPYWIDATMRIGSPPGELVQEWITNLGEVIYEGARGNVAEFEFSHKFACQVALYSTWQATHWQAIDVDKDKSSRVKIYVPCAKNGHLHSIPSEVLNSPWPTDEHVGYALGFGDTIEEMITDVNATLNSVSGFELEDRRMGLVDIIKEVQESEDEGIEFTDQEVPDPTTVINGE